MQTKKNQPKNYVATTTAAATSVAALELSLDAFVVTSDTLMQMPNPCNNHIKVLDRLLFCILLISAF